MDGHAPGEPPRGPSRRVADPNGHPAKQVEQPTAYAMVSPGVFTDLRRPLGRVSSPWRSRLLRRGLR